MANDLSCPLPSSFCHGGNLGSGGSGSLCAKVMNALVVALRNHLDIFWAIVALIPIFVVNLLARQQESAEHFFHHKSMFANISVFHGMRVIPAEGQDVPACVYTLAPTPTWVVRPSLLSFASIADFFFGFRTMRPSFWPRHDLLSTCSRFFSKSSLEGQL